MERGSNKNSETEDSVQKLSGEQRKEKEADTKYKSSGFVFSM